MLNTPRCFTPNAFSTPLFLAFLNDDVRFTSRAGRGRQGGGVRRKKGGRRSRRDVSPMISCFRGASTPTRLAVAMVFLACRGLFASGERQEVTRRSLGEAVAFENASRACFRLVLLSPWGNGWRKATYSILDDDEVVIAEGTLLDGNYKKTDKVCVVRPACYAIRVTKGSSITWQQYSWNLGDGVLKGGVPADTETFFVSAEGAVSPGCNTSSPTFSPAPTTTPLPSRRPTLTRPCFDVVLSNGRYVGNGWDGAIYSIFSDDGVVVANGTLLIEGDVNRTDTICVPVAPVSGKKTIRASHVSFFRRATPCK